MKKFYTLNWKHIACAAIMLSATSLNAQVLYDNGPYFNNAGGGPAGSNLSVLYTTTFGMGTIGFGHQQTAFNRVADDFVNTNCTWMIDSIVFFGYQTGSTTTSTFTGVTLRIWDSIPNAVGSNVVYGDTTTNRMTRTVWSGTYRVTETAQTSTTRPIMRNVCTTPGLTVPAGTFWIDWASSGSLASGPWAPARVPANQAVTGNGRQRIGSTWNNALDGGTGTPAQGFPFIIYGTIVQPSASAGLDISFCLGDSSAIGGAPSGSGGTGPLTYSWSNAIELSSGTAANPVASPTMTTTFVLTVTDAAACVDMDTVVVAVLQSSTNTLAPTVCGSYLSPEGNTYTTSGTYMDTLTNMIGCDSVITINLTVINASTASISPVACYMYTAPSGAMLMSSGMFMDTIANMAGCDSVITINLTINGTTTSAISPTVCDMYTSPSGMMLMSSGTYMDTIANMNGCDSVITINLTINGTTTSTISPTVCDMYTSPSGMMLMSSGTYMDTIANMNGCDSVITIQLTVNSVDTGVSMSGVVLTADAIAAIYQWVNCDSGYSIIGGATSQSFLPTSDGNYAVIVTENSCTDTSACILVLGTGIQSTTTSLVTLYPNPATDNVTVNCGTICSVVMITITDINGRVIAEQKENGVQLINVNTNFSQGTYFMTIVMDGQKEVKRLIIQ